MADRLTISDVRKAGFCVRGIKQWWEAQPDDLPSFREFVREGVDMEIAERSTDPLAVKSCEIARKRIQSGGT